MYRPNYFAIDPAYLALRPTSTPEPTIDPALLTLPPTSTRPFPGHSLEELLNFNGDFQVYDNSPLSFQDPYANSVLHLQSPYDISELSDDDSSAVDDEDEYLDVLCQRNYPECDGCGKEKICQRRLELFKFYVEQRTLARVDRHAMMEAMRAAELPFEIRNQILAHLVRLAMNGGSYMFHEDQDLQAQVDEILDRLQLRSPNKLSNTDPSERDNYMAILDLGERTNAEVIKAAFIEHHPFSNESPASYTPISPVLVDYSHLIRHIDIVVRLLPHQHYPLPLFKALKELPNIKSYLPSLKTITVKLWIPEGLAYLKKQLPETADMEFEDVVARLILVLCSLDVHKRTIEYLRVNDDSKRPEYVVEKATRAIGGVEVAHMRLQRNEKIRRDFSFVMVEKFAGLQVEDVDEVEE